KALIQAWEAALRAPVYADKPRLFHGDLHWGNLLARDGQLHAVIDWGCFAKGDPAVDLLPGWWLFDPSTRQTFLQATGADADEIARGRGWALSIALIGLAYYRDGRNEVLAAMNRTAISAVLDDLG
ncbi:MAG: phosphotransferase, partial [Deltaproteobacteria bacterium]